MKLIVILSTGLLFTACMQSKMPVHITSSSAALIDTMRGSCPYLTKDNKGRVVLSWLRQLNDSTAVFCYSVSKDEGKTFGKPMIIPSSTKVHPHEENLPKIIYKPSGEMIAVWGAANPNPKNLYSGLIYYAQSLDEGKTWSDAKKLVQDTAGYDQRYFDVALLPNGEAAIIWLDNRKTINKDGAALYFAATRGSSGFGNEKRIEQPCCECCRTSLFVDSKSNIHVLYRAIINDSIRDMVHSVSTDGGKTFAAAQRISKDNWVIRGCPHTGPAMAENKTGLQFAWYTGGNESGVFYNYSDDNGRSFSAKDTISNSRLSRHPQLASLSNDAVVIVWDQTIKKEDKFYSRIGMQVRAKDGSSLLKEYVTPDTAAATYPVIRTLNDNRFIIACSIDKKGKSYVAYQVIKVD